MTGQSVPLPTQALQHAGIGIEQEQLAELDLARCGILIGTAMGGMSTFSTAVEDLTQKVLGPHSSMGEGNSCTPRGTASPSARYEWTQTVSCQELETSQSMHRRTLPRVQTGRGLGCMGVIYGTARACRQAPFWLVGACQARKTTQGILLVSPHVLGRKVVRFSAVGSAYTGV